jgi:hypothetical protein
MVFLFFVDGRGEHVLIRNVHERPLQAVYGPARTPAA